MENASETGDPALWPEILAVYRDHPVTRWRLLWHARFYWLEHPGLVVPLLQDAIRDPALRNDALETAAYYPAMVDAVVASLTDPAFPRRCDKEHVLGSLAYLFGLQPEPLGWCAIVDGRYADVVQAVIAELKRRYGIDPVLAVTEIRHRKTGAVLLRHEDDSLEGVDLSWMDLQGADLQRATLCDTRLHDANLSDADLRGADLRRADLRGTNLTRADLREADLRDADLCGAILEATRLEDAALEGARLQEALYDHRARWPYGFDPRKHGASRVD